MVRLGEVLAAGGWPLLAGWLALNLLAFLQVGCDKRRARGGRRRLSEHRLCAPAALGALPGVLLGMGAFRHKTRKVGFHGRLAAYTLVSVTWLVLLVLALNDWQWRW